MTKRKMPITSMEVGEKTASSTIWLVVAISTVNMMKVYTMEHCALIKQLRMGAHDETAQNEGATGIALYTSIRGWSHGERGNLHGEGRLNKM